LKKENPKSERYLRNIQIKRKIDHQEERYQWIHETTRVYIFQLLAIEADVLSVVPVDMNIDLSITVLIVKEHFV